MYSVGIHALCVDKSRKQLRTLLQPEEMELLMLDIFNWDDVVEDWRKHQVSYWRVDTEMGILQSNLNSWSF